jgi:hypothetical protein
MWFFRWKKEEKKKKKKEKEKNKLVSVVNAGSENDSSDGGATGTWVVA